jgi:phosphoribosyl-AMP cyclohydrolase
MHMTDVSKNSPALQPGETIEKTLSFLPKFGSDGLIPAIVTDAKSGNVLMFAHMNEEALRQTVASGVAHFWSRSRARLWKKGEESGNLLNVREVRTDCDQDVVWLLVDVGGDGVACHTGETSCFYRRVVSEADAPDGMILEIAALPRPVGHG